MRLRDELRDTGHLRAATPQAPQVHFSDEQTLEPIYSVGLYHLVSILANGLDLDSEPFAARFDDVRPAS